MLSDKILSSLILVILGCNTILVQSSPALFEKYPLKNSGRISLEAFLDQNEITENPVIGIVSQKLESGMQKDPRFADYNSYIMTAYATFIEAAGARVVPLIQGEPEEVTLDKLSKLNGVLFPGGDGDYLEFGRFIFNKIKEYNDNGIYYPAWGTCLGFEAFMLYVADDEPNVLERFELQNTSLPLKFTTDPHFTKMFNWLNDDAFYFEELNLTYNAHSWGVSPNRFVADKGLGDFFEVTSVSYLPEDTNETNPFIATIEAKKYPFFGTQFHPEMTSQTWRIGNNVNHSWISIQLNKHFADYFVWLSRHNKNSFGSFYDAQPRIIQNSELVVTTDWWSSSYVYK